MGIDMKRTIVFVLGLTLVSAPSWAQRGFAGLVGGATLSDFGSTVSSSRWGGTAGVTVGFRTYTWSVVAIEGAWTQRGDENVRLDYIDVPLTIGGVASAGNDVRFRIYGGIDLAFKISCKSEAAVLNCDNANSTQWLLPFGIMFGRWTRQGTAVGVDVRYLVGLSDAFSISPIYNRGWQFRLFVARPVGR
jgi:hypothetical protein